MVASAKAFKPGDMIIIRRIGNAEWINELGLSSEKAGKMSWRPFNVNYDRAGANTVFWNCEGDYMVQNPPTARNNSFGHI
jgi:hypothetical protein